MDFKNLCVLVLWTKVASALGGLSTICSDHNILLFILIVFISFRYLNVKMEDHHLDADAFAQVSLLEEDVIYL